MSYDNQQHEIIIKFAISLKNIFFIELINILVNFTVGPRRMLLADMRDVESAADVGGLQDIKNVLSGPSLDSIGLGKRAYTWMDIGVSDNEDDDDGGGPPRKAKRVRLDHEFATKISKMVGASLFEFFFMFLKVLHLFFCI